MRNRKWKKMQRQVNKSVRAMNKNIYDDELWMGRFYAHQIWSEYTEYEDHSGGALRVELRFTDKATNYSTTRRLAYYGNLRFFDSDLWRAMNDFICEDCKVWEHGDLFNEKKDYRKDKRQC